jgi:hypothetical protein
MIHETKMKTQPKENQQITKKDKIKNNKKQTHTLQTTFKIARI